MKTNILKSITIVGALLSANVMAEEQNYFGGSFNFITGSSDWAGESNDDGNLAVVNLRVGKFINENFSFEARAGLGLKDSTLGDSTLKINTNLGAFGRVGYTVEEKFYPYFIAGYTHTEAEFRTNGATGEEFKLKKNSFSYGLGLDYRTDNDGPVINVEYLNYFDEVGLEVTGLSIGFTGNF